MRTPPPAASMRRMTETSTYAVAWREGPARYVGHVELRADQLRLEGRGPVGQGLRAIPYADITRVEVHRVNGSRGIALALPRDGLVEITSLDRPGSLAELADRLRKLTDSPQG